MYIKISILLVLFLITISPISVYSAAKTPKDIESFETSKAWQKLDLRLKGAWKASIDSKSKGATVDCMMKTSKKIGADEKAILQSAGFKARTIIDKIATGSMKMEDVPKVAALDFVEVIELAVPMTMKRK